MTLPPMPIEAVYPQKSPQSFLLFARPPSAVSLRAVHGRRILEKCMASDHRHGDQLFNGVPRQSTDLAKRWL